MQGLLFSKIQPPGYCSLPDESPSVELVVRNVATAFCGKHDEAFPLEFSDVQAALKPWVAAAGDLL